MMSTVQYYQPSLEVDMHLSDAAKTRLIKVIQSTEGAKAMRLSVRKTGCSGYSYDLQVVSEMVADDLVLEIQDTYKLYIEVKSYPLLKGLSIDYVKQGLQTKFVFENPMQTGQCGCGESFTIEK
jgi:iron-sulfur cluster assembly protein